MNLLLTPEQKARKKIDEMLQRCGGIVQDRDKINFGAGQGIAMQEYITEAHPYNYVYFVNRMPVGVV